MKIGTLVVVGPVKTLPSKDGTKTYQRIDCVIDSHPFAAFGAFNVQRCIENSGKECVCVFSRSVSPHGYVNESLDIVKPLPTRVAGFNAETLVHDDDSAF